MVVLDEEEPMPVPVSDQDHCATCGKLIGRAGRTSQEIMDALDRGEFSAAIGSTDYSVEPAITTYYCPPCWGKQRTERENLPS